MISFPTVAAAVVSTVPFGYEIDCTSWPGGFRASVVVHLVAADGTEFTTGRAMLPPDSKPADAQAVFWSAIVDSGWDIRFGEKNTVLVFGPKGRGVRSIRFESDEWIPVYKRVLGKSK